MKREREGERERERERIIWEEKKVKIKNIVINTKLFKSCYVM